jgi:hypothetical protein
MATSKNTPKPRKHRELSPSHSYSLPRPVKRVERSYSRRRKQDVLLFLFHHRIPKTLNTSEFIHRSSIPAFTNSSRILSGLEDSVEDGFRRPTSKEAAVYFQIASEKTVRKWWESRDRIFGSKIPRSVVPKWPALEEELIKRFTAARNENKIVTVHWFRRVSQQIWEQLYPHISEVFVFSHGCFWRCLHRHGIVRRRITKVATKTPQAVADVTNCFIQFVRRNSCRESVFASIALRSSPPDDSEFTSYWKQSSLCKFPSNLIINLDKIPLPFEFLSGYSYDFKGASTMAGKSERSGWDKRQATIILYIMADGSTPFKPVIIFHGKGTVAK